MFRYIILFIIIIVSHSCNYQHQLTIIDYSSQDHLRILQTNNIHNFKIFGHLASQRYGYHTDLSLLMNIFKISAKYFQKLIKVIPVPSYLTKFTSKSGKCGVDVPLNYIQQGFDQNIMDLVVFINIQNSLQLSYVASAAPCLKVRRPLYGIINFNTAYISTDITHTGTYHLNIYVTIHQLTHILGFNQKYFNEFYLSPISTEKLRLDEVIGTVPDNPYRKMIITNNVKKYVKNYFKCQNNYIGALLEDQGNYLQILGSQGSAGSHWERKVYHDQIMTASTFASGLKMSELTLSLLKDTGFYYQVDISLAEQLYFGKYDGCKFANGVSIPEPEYSCLSSCDFYNVYGGFCSDKDQFSNGASYIRPYSNAICTFPENQKKSLNTNFIFSSDSRCFDVLNNSKLAKPHCYHSYCESGNLKIVMNNNMYICNSNVNSIIIGNATLLCPKDIDIFCSVKYCDNWCNAHGICINGKCICIEPFYGQNCQLGCTLLFDYETNSCVDNCDGKFIYNKQCLSECPMNMRAINNNCQFYQESQLGQTFLNIGVLLIIILVLN